MSYPLRREHNIVVLGAGGVGKSCLTARFVQDVWIESYDPTIEDSYRKAVNVDGTPLVLEILDTAGTEQFTAMRELYMKQGQGFLLVYSIASRNSFQELAELHESIVRIKDDENVPIVLVGNKNDMPREDREIDRMEATWLAEHWGHKPFFEVSAKRDAVQLIEAPFLDLCRQILAQGSAREQMYEQQYGGTGAGAGASMAAASGSTLRPPLFARADTYRHRHRHHRKRDRCVIL